MRISDRDGEINRSHLILCVGKLTTTNDQQLTFRRLHPQLFHPLSDLLEVCVRDPHGIGYELVTWRIG